MPNLSSLAGLVLAEKFGVVVVGGVGTTWLLVLLKASRFRVALS